MTGETRAAPFVLDLRSALDALDEGIAILDAEGVVRFANRTALKVLNIDEEELVGWPLLEFEWEIVDEDGRPLPRESHPALAVLRGEPPPPPTVMGVRTPLLDEILWVEVTSRPLLSGDGAIAGSVSAFRDVSQHRKARRAEQALRWSEARFEALVSQVPVGIFQTDAAGACVYVNEAWCRITGLTEEEALGDGWAKALHPEDRERVWKRWEAAAEEQAPFREEYRVLTPEGEVRWVVGTAVPVPGADGSPAAFLGSLTDITVTKESARLRDELLGIVSHELRAPLVAISGALRHLEDRKDVLDDQGRALLEMAERNASLLHRLVEDLLDMERLSTGGREFLKMEAVEMSSVLEHAAELGRELGAERGVRVSTAVEGGDFILHADRDRLIRALTNLVSNAVKASPEGGEVLLEARAADGIVYVAVSDEGVGIPAEAREKIFEPFVQAEDAEGKEGAGLGLTIARRIIERHGGRIWVEDRPGGGSVFRFTIPQRPGTPSGE